MKVGGYKNNPNASDIDLSEKVQNTEPAVTTEPVTDTKPVVEPAVTKEEAPTAPEIQDTSKEIQETGQFDDKKIKAETVEKTEEDSSLNTQQTTEPVVEHVVEEKVETDVKVEISDEQYLKYLSEKLGREVKSLDDLTKTENPLDSDPYLKELAAWREKTGRPIEDWVKFQKDYAKVPDIDVAREFLQLEYPELTPEQIDLELNHKYLASEEDLDTDVALKNLELKKLASKGRKELTKLVSDLGTLKTDNLAPEVKQDLEIAKQYKNLVKQNEAETAVYNQKISSKASELKSIKMDLAEGVSLDFKLPEGSSKKLVNTIQEAPHWKNADGSWNHDAIVRDAAIIANFNTMLKLAYEQGENSGAEGIIKEANNTTLESRTQSSSALPQGEKGVQVEGLDNYLGKKGMRIIRGKR